MQPAVSLWMVVHAATHTLIDALPNDLQSAKKSASGRTPKRGRTE